MTIDHIELLVPDRDAAVAWYREWLGFEPMPEHADWAQSGPIMLTCAQGRTVLALFRGEPLGAGPPKGWRRLALRKVRQQRPFAKLPQIAHGRG